MDLPVGDLVVAPGPARPPVAERLVGSTVELVPQDPARDAEALFRLSSGSPERDAIWTYMFKGPFASASELRAWLDAMAADASVLTFTVRRRDDGAVAGMCQYLNVVPEMRRLEVGNIWYGLEHQRTSANTEATLLLLEHAFEHLGYRRVEWKCDALNLRSRRAALRLGFRAEGVFRQHMIVKGRNRDTAWFALTDGDWPRARDRLRARVAGVTPAPRTYDGGCHCGRVRFRVTADLDSVAATECNCSICTKKGYLHLIVAPDQFQLVSGAEDLTTYAFGTGTAKHQFCRVCGVHPFYVPRSDPDKIDVNVRALDGIDPRAVALEPFDGRNWERAKADRDRTR